MSDRSGGATATEEPTTAGAASRRLLSAGAVMASGTLVSRVLGFGRLMLLVFLFGNGTRQAEMFTLANTVPNSMYILLAGGVLNTVLVPQIVRAIRTDPDGGEAYTNRIMTAGMLVLGAITVVLTLAVPWIIAAYSAAAWKTPALAGQYASMVTLGYYCMPQVFFYGVHVLAGQVLNARDRFGPMMWAPIANNVVSIAVLLLFWSVFGRGNPGTPFTDGEELLLGLGATLGIAMQAAVLVPYLRAVGYRFRPRFDFAHTGLGHTVRLAKWTLGFVLVTQAGLVVVNRLASGAAVGGSGAGLLAYANAHAVWILPHSLITVSLATAMLPSASRMAAAGDLPGVAAETLRTLRLALTALLPAAVAFAVLGVPIAELLFGFGLGSRDAVYVGWALMAFAVALVPFTVQYICLRAFYSLEDTRTPFLLQLLITGVNVVAAVLLVGALGQPSLVATGLAAAYSLAYTVGVLVTFRTLARRLPGLSARGLPALGGRLLVASLPAAGVAWLVCEAISRWSDTQGARLLGLVLAGIPAVALLLVLARLLRIAEVTAMIDTVRRRRTAGRSDPGSPGDSSGAEGAGEPTIGATMPDQPPSSAPAVRATGTPEDADEMATHVGAARSEPATLTGPPLAPAWSEAEPARQTSALHAGAVLAERYRLEELRSSEAAPTVIWRAFDLVLSRSVLVHLLPPGDPRTAELLAAARRAAGATDSRFLRVLDAVPSDDPELGSYVVSEYATGQSLQTVLESGPLSGLEAAWVVREIADALAGVHALGITHRRISPASVVITPPGNVKILGLLIDAAVRPAPEADRDESAVSDPEQADVADLGRLLYACLVARWPGGPAYGLPDAPRLGRQWATPRQVRAGVSPALDDLCDRLLGDPPRHRAEPIRSAAALAIALTKVLGTADASGDLERRLRQPIPTVSGHDQGPDTQAFALPPAAAPAGAPATVALSGPAVTPAAAPTVRTAMATTRGSTTRGSAPGSTPTRVGPAGAVGRPGRRPARRWIPLLLAVILLGGSGLAVGIVGQQWLGLRGSAASSPEPTDPSAKPSPTVRRALEFDPQGGDKTENPDEVPLALDGDPDTRWRTVSYRGNPELGGIKRGVGLVLDLGAPVEVSGVRVTLSGRGTDLEARVPQRPADRPPMTSDRQWRRVGAEQGATGRVEIPFAEPATTRYVLVYLTSLPREGSGYRGGIAEVGVW